MKHRCITANISVYGIIMAVSFAPGKGINIVPVNTMPVLKCKTDDVWKTGLIYQVSAAEPRWRASKLSLERSGLAAAVFQRVTYVCECVPAL